MEVISISAFFRRVFLKFETTNLDEGLFFQYFF